MTTPLIDAMAEKMHPTTARAAMQSTAAIKRCIDGVAHAKDGRGRYQNEAALRMRLMRDGSSETIAAATAKAARVVGEGMAEGTQREPSEAAYLGIAAAVAIQPRRGITAGSRRE